jgi:Ran GTPase-activating protein (RanGAP) involved in mRNA processing and transport
MKLTADTARAELASALTTADDTHVYEAVLDLLDRVFDARLPAADLAAWTDAAAAGLLERRLPLDALTTYAPLEPRMSSLVFRLQDTELAELWPAATLPNLLTLGAGTAAIDWRAMPDCRWPHLRRIKVYEGPGVASGFFEWLGRQALPSLRELTAYAVGMTHDDLAALHRGSFWGNLEVLDLGRNEIGADAAWPPMPAIRQLGLARGGHGAKTMASLTATPLRALESLNIAGNPIGNVGFDFLARRSLPALRRLEARACSLTEGHAWRSLRSTSWPALRELDLQDDLSEPALIGDLAVVFRQLEALDISSTQLTNDGARELAAVEWPRLGSLSMLFNQVSDEGAEALAGAAFPALKQLGLSGNPIGNRGMHSLLRAPWWDQLEVLDVVNLELTDDGVHSLAASLPSRLRELHLLARPYSPQALAAVRNALPPGATLS